MAAQAIKFYLPDDAATAHLGAGLAKLLRPGDLVLLEGDLGTGKSALARAIIRAMLNAPEMDVPSPSFALVQPYQGQGFNILHADLYRLSSQDELDELGFDDDPETIALVEWPQRAPALEGEAAILIALEMAPGGAGRQARLRFAQAERHQEASHMLTAQGFGPAR